MTSAQQPPIAAAIDIGSNSIKMTIGRQIPGDGFEQIDWLSEVVRLGQGIDETGRLSDDRVEAAILTLARFAEHARALGAQEILAVATEATRAAENGTIFLDRVRHETGIDVRIVDGLEEAALTFRGLTTTTDVSGNVVVADIGGGSTELIVAADGCMISSLSIPLGSGRLTERQIRTDPPTLDELANS
jgi:exopolyphosphatase/guanosine-5'-triphosphate,3'-diphosphate pyrophosphatase